MYTPSISLTYKSGFRMRSSVLWSKTILIQLLIPKQRLKTEFIVFFHCAPNLYNQKVVCMIFHQGNRHIYQLNDGLLLNFYPFTKFSERSRRCFCKFNHIISCSSLFLTSSIYKVKFHEIGFLGSQVQITRQGPKQMFILYGTY